MSGAGALAPTSRKRTRIGYPGIFCGCAIPLLFVAYLNRDGPGALGWLQPNLHSLDREDRLVARAVGAAGWLVHICRISLAEVSTPLPASQPHPSPSLGPQQSAFAVGSQQVACCSGAQQVLVAESVVLNSAMRIAL